MSQINFLNKHFGIKKIKPSKGHGGGFDRHQPNSGGQREMFGSSGSSTKPRSSEGYLTKPSNARRVQDARRVTPRAKKHEISLARVNYKDSEHNIW